MKRFKPEFQYCKVTVTSPLRGKITIDIQNADANAWADIPEVAFMIEDDVEEVAPIKTVVFKPTPVNDYEAMTLGELRELFPDIKATSKRAFIDQLI